MANIFGNVISLTKEQLSVNDGFQFVIFDIIIFGKKYVYTLFVFITTTFPYKAYNKILTF